MRTNRSPEAPGSIVLSTRSVSNDAQSGSTFVTTLVTSIAEPSERSTLERRSSWSS